MGLESGFPEDDLDSSSEPSLKGSSRRSRSGSQLTSIHHAHGYLAEEYVTSSSSSMFVPTSKRVYQVLKDYATQLVDINLFTQYVEDWVLEIVQADSASVEQPCSLPPPFEIDELCVLDYALEGVLFQQLSRMPSSSSNSENLQEDEFLALEDFLHTMAEGLWRTFWHKKKPFPFSASFPRYPGSKFYSIEKAASRGRLEELSGAALVSNTNGLHVHWDDVVEFALFKPDVMMGNKSSFHSTIACEALFYAVHILLSRSLSKRNSVTSDCVFVLILDSKYGGLVKLTGDLGNLEVDLKSPYQSLSEWIKYHANVSFSPVEQIWNTLGNVNWRDLGTLQMILATFHAMTQWLGPPRKSLASLAARHSLRLQKRRVEYHQLIENDFFQQEDNRRSREIEDIDALSSSKIKKGGASRLKLNEGDILEIEDQNLNKKKTFRIQEDLSEGNHFSYIAVALLDLPSELCTLHVGAHSSRLEPSWEDMSLWYQVQRQTKVLNIIKQNSTDTFLPKLVVSGRILHPGPCKKQNPKGCCDHPWCGTPVLVTQPVGESLSSVVACNGPFTAEEAIRCCRDCLAALRNAKTANIQHGDICPENIIRVVNDEHNTYSYVLVSWGRAVLEDRDSPTMNLQFSSAYALQNGKLCLSSDTESLVYVMHYICSGKMHQQDSVESALQWRQENWGKRLIQQQIGEVSTLLKAFADYIDSLCGTPYLVDYETWLRRLSRAVDGGSADRGQSVGEILRIKDVAESSGTSGGDW